MRTSAIPPSSALQTSDTSREPILVVETTTPGTAGGMPEGASGMVRVTMPTTGSGYAVINGGNIHSAAHLIPEEPVSSGIPNKSWIVNSHIDLATWNDVYYYI